MSDPDSFIGQIIGNIDNKFEFVAVLIYMILLGGVTIAGMILKYLSGSPDFDTYIVVPLFALGLGIKGVTSKIQKVLPSKTTIDIQGGE